MNDWMQTGLTRQSYIDTGTLLRLPLSTISKGTHRTVDNSREAKTA